MNRAVTRLIGTAVLVALSAGISAAGITDAGSRKATFQRGATEANGIQELLDFIYQCRGCDGDREGRGGSGFASPAGGLYQSLVMELSSTAIATRQIWMATHPATAGELTVSIGAAGPADEGLSSSRPARTIAYLGGVSDSFASSATEAFRGRGGGRGAGGSQGFGHKPDTLAAVPEPAPIFLLGTILLATFSIARLRFNR